MDSELSKLDVTPHEVDVASEISSEQGANGNAGTSRKDAFGGPQQEVSISMNQGFPTSKLLYEGSILTNIEACIILINLFLRYTLIRVPVTDSVHPVSPPPLSKFASCYHLQVFKVLCYF